MPLLALASLLLVALACGEGSREGTTSGAGAGRLGRDSVGVHNPYVTPIIATEVPIWRRLG